MMRRGFRRMDSIALTALGIFSRSSGFSPNGSIAGGKVNPDAGICGGMGEGVGVFSFIPIQRLSLDLVQVQQTQQSVENSFVEVSFESGCADELHGKSRCADEWRHSP